MREHSATPWVIPAGEHNAFIICSGDNPDKPGDILMVVRSPAGRRTIASDHQVDANVAMMVKAVNSHEALKASLAEMVGIYWGDGDGIDPPPACIQRALVVLASIEVQS